MSTKPIVLAEQVIFVVGGANDAPGFKIVGDGRGGFKVVPVPGWNPEQAAELAAALKIVASAAQIKQPDASHAILNAAAKLASSEIAHLAGAPAAGAPATVVVVAL
jgi:hypothetical protein